MSEDADGACQSLSLLGSISTDLQKRKRSRLSIEVRRRLSQAQRSFNLLNTPHTSRGNPSPIFFHFFLLFCCFFQ